MAVTITNQPQPRHRAPGDEPREVEALIRRHRDRQPPGGNAWRALDQLLNEIKETTQP
jgi:hypothetical protein